MGGAFPATEISVYVEWIWYCEINGMTAHEFLCVSWCRCSTMIHSSMSEHAKQCPDSFVNGAALRLLRYFNCAKKNTILSIVLLGWFTILSGWYICTEIKWVLGTGFLMLPVYKCFLVCYYGEDQFLSQTNYLLLPYVSKRDLYCKEKEEGNLAKLLLIWLS